MLSMRAALALGTFAVLCIAALVMLIPVDPYDGITGSTRLTQARLCPVATAADCTGRIVSLPHTVLPGKATGVSHVRFGLTFDGPDTQDDVTGIYLPKFSDAMAMQVNGVPLTSRQQGASDTDMFHHWHRPFLVKVPNALLLPEGNRIDITLSGFGYQNISLYPVYVGPVLDLDFSYQIRTIIRVGMARVNFALGVLAGVALLLFWLMHWRDVTYLYLAGASLTGAAVCYYWVYPNFAVDYRVWIVWWNAAAMLQLWFTLNFVAAYLHARLYGSRVASFAALVVLACGLLLASDPSVRLWLSLFQLSALLLGLFILAVLLAHRDRTTRLNFCVLFTLYAAALALAVVEWLTQYVTPDRTTMEIAPLIPVLFVLSLLWVIFYQLSVSLSQYEGLTRSLQTTVEERTAELQASYAKLAAQAKHQAIDEERQRILLDLHDGVGGQLVNTLAYMATRPEQDPVLQTALEDALRDMGLIIDSLEAGDSIATQLGLLRGRLEPLMRRHHTSLIWQILEEPVLPGARPSQNLSLLRIVHEAITNALKHARPGSITVSTTASSITVADDGCGFDPADLPQRSGSGSGIGLTGMQRRAQSIGVDLQIDSAGAGTRLPCPGRWWRVKASGSKPESQGIPLSADL